MKRLLSMTHLELRWEPRWPAIAVGFYGGKTCRRVFVVLVSPLVVLIGRRT